MAAKFRQIRLPSMVDGVYTVPVPVESSIVGINPLGSAGRVAGLAVILAVFDETSPTEDRQVAIVTIANTPVITLNDFDSENMGVVGSCTYALGTGQYVTTVAFSD